MDLLWLLLSSKEHRANSHTLMMENKFHYGSYGYVAILDFNTAEKFASIEPRVSIQYMYEAVEKILKQYNPNASGKLLTLSSNIPSLKKYQRTLALLTDFYFSSKYPSSEYIEPTLEDSKELIQDVKQIFKIIGGDSS